MVRNQLTNMPYHTFIKLPTTSLVDLGCRAARGIFTNYYCSFTEYSSNANFNSLFYLSYKYKMEILRVSIHYKTFTLQMVSAWPKNLGLKM